MLGRLPLRCGFVATGLGVALAELLDAPCRIHELLLACIEWMASATDFDLQLSDRCARVKRAAATASNLAGHVFGMNSVLHNLHEHTLRVRLQVAKTINHRPCAVS